MQASRSPCDELPVVLPGVLGCVAGFEDSVVLGAVLEEAGVTSPPQATISKAIERTTEIVKAKTKNFFKLFIINLRFLCSC